MRFQLVTRGPQVVTSGLQVVGRPWLQVLFPWSHLVSRRLLVVCQWSTSGIQVVTSGLQVVASSSYYRVKVRNSGRLVGSSSMQVEFKCYASGMEVCKWSAPSMVSVSKWSQVDCKWLQVRGGQRLRLVWKWLVIVVPKEERELLRLR